MADTIGITTYVRHLENRIRLLSQELMLAKGVRYGMVILAFLLGLAIGGFIAYHIGRYHGLWWR